MPRASYQYGTSPRKYEPEYNYPRRTNKKTEVKRTSKKEDAKKTIEKQKAEQKAQKIQKAKERKSKMKQVIVVGAIFGMLLTVSYREISIMEMFNQTKQMENQLAVIEKENGQVEKSIKEEESKLDWNEIKRRASEELGMQTIKETKIELDRTDNVEVEHKLIQEENQSIIEKIVSFIVNR